MEKVRKTIMIYPEKYKKLKRIALDQDISVSDLMDKIFNDFLKSKNPGEKDFFA